MQASGVHCGCRIVLALVLSGSLWRQPANADQFTILNEGGETIEVDARLTGSGQGLHALELADGQLLLVPQRAVKKHEHTPDPEPLTGAAVAERLMEKFGNDRFFVHVEKPFVIGCVLTAPVGENRSEVQFKSLLKKGHRFMRSVQGMFLKFTRNVRVEAKPLKFPLVVLIFETDRRFNQYARYVTGNQGLSAGNIAGFYDALSNQLVLRMSECRTFDTPLHEAIHQQTYNREILQRLAPIPVWFNEGMATGFEGDGERIRSGPRQVSGRYARLALTARSVDWREIVRNDRAFQGDIFAGEAYGHAWGLHWLMVKKYRTKYIKYIQLLGQKKTLAIDEPEKRLKEFEETIGKNVAVLQREFYVTIASSLKRKRAAIGPRLSLNVFAMHSHSAGIKIREDTRLIAVRLR